MRLWKKILLTVLVLLVGLVALFLLLIGPWPTYASVDLPNASYYRNAVAAIDRSAAASTVGASTRPLRAGWAKQSIVPPIGTPLAGFGDREGKPSTGVHDEVFVKVLVLSDGTDTVAVVGSDMLIVPENLAEKVRADVGLNTTLQPDDILFTSTHTHSGPGAWAPGLAAKSFSGAYDPKVLDFLAQRFTDAIVEAHGRLEPAAMAYGSVDASDLVRNRARKAEVDGILGFLLVEQENKDRCVLMRYSAHPTILGGDNMEFSGDFPGYAQRAIEEKTGAFGMYLGGALGSMSSRAPEAADDFARAAAMGEAIAGRVLDELPKLVLERNVDVASVGAPIDLPPMQLRINRKLRLSPFVFRLLGVDSDGWVHAVRLGNLYLVGMPCDFSGELGIELHRWAKEQGRELWVTSFNGDYVGYISPDRYYNDPGEKAGLESYEMGLMSWCGPNGGSYFVDLSKHMVEALSRPTPSTS